jgi:curved DNA-binding protein CbpA
MPTAVAETRDHHTGLDRRVITHYSILGVSETAIQAEIKTSYRALLKKIHPDTVDTLSPELRCVAEEVTRRIVEAYAVLSEPERRWEYDRQLAQHRQEAIRATVIPSARPTERRHGVRRRKYRRRLNDPLPLNAGILLVLLAGLAYYVCDLSLDLVDLLK